MTFFVHLWVCDVMCTARATSTQIQNARPTIMRVYTSKHDIGINVQESHYFASVPAFMNHSLNPAMRLLCGGTQRNTAKRLPYTGTRYVVIVTGHSDKMLSKARNYMKVYNSARDHKMRLMQLFPLNLHSHEMRAIYIYTPARLLGGRGGGQGGGRAIFSAQPKMLYHTGQG